MTFIKDLYKTIICNISLISNEKKETYIIILNININ